METLMGFFKDIELLEEGKSVDLEEAISAIPWGSDGLIPAIAQQFDSKEVLMLAWLSEDALRETLKTGFATYFSRSRQKLWKKGELSGQTQALKEMRLDCDGDAALILVDQNGPACHTGRRKCFYLKISGNRLINDKKILISPEKLYEKGNKS
tara:strand:+ start:151 stop:609 length:459 start_codon:yes stop_codon:yes gene_type:complete